MNIVVGLLVGATFFIACISSYLLGLKHNKIISNGNIPKMEIPFVQPVKEVIKHFEAKKEEKVIESAISEYWR